MKKFLKNKPKISNPHKRFILLFMALLLPLNACGVDFFDLPFLTKTSKIKEVVSQVTLDDQNKIMEELNALDAKLLRLEKTLTLIQNNLSSNSGIKVVSEQDLTPVFETIAAKPATPTPSPESTGKIETSKGRKILDKIIETVQTAPGIEASLIRYETKIENTKETVMTKTKFYADANQRVKIEVVESSDSTSQGARVLYHSGTNEKVKIRPGGALGLVALSFDINDKKLSTLNQYRMDEADIFGISKRLSNQDYEAELSGVTTINSEKIYLLKIHPKNENALDPRISYELLGFEPDTFVPRLWEAYTDTASEPFFRLMIESLSVKEDIPEEIFKV